MITRLRLDATLYEPAPPRNSGTMGRSCLKGKSNEITAIPLTDKQINK
jgi:hypothetical protein